MTSTAPVRSQLSAPVVARWRDGLARLAGLDDVQRARYEAVVDAVYARLRRYDSVDLLVTTYYQGSDFAAEAIRSLFPGEARVWDIFLIEDAAWGRRLTDLERMQCDPTPFSACSKRAEAAGLDAKGKRLLDEGDVAGARVAFGDATSLAPEVAEFWEHLGTAFGRLGDWRWAKDAFTRAIAIASTPRREAFLAEIQAIRRLLGKLATRPSDAAAHLQVGMLLMAWDHGDLALAHFQRAVALAPNWPDAHLHRGLELHYREEWEAAAEAYRAALALDPRHKRAWRLLDSCRRHQLPPFDEDPLDGLT